MKKLVSLFLLFVLLLSISGHFLAFKASQFSIKQEIKSKIKNRIAETDLVLITFSLSEIEKIKWEENGKEFWHNGDIYDVVKCDTSNGNVRFYCINDKQEKALFSNLEDLITRQMNSENQGKNNSLKKFQTNYFLTPTFSQIFTFELYSPFSFGQSRLFKGFFSDIAQPPEQA